MHTQKGRTDAARGSSPFGAGSFAPLSIYISHLGAAALPQDCPDHCVVILSLESDGGWCASVSQRSCAPYTRFTYGACSGAPAVERPLFRPSARETIHGAHASTALGAQ